MAKTLQFRRDTTANLASVTGSVGEIFIDTTKDTVVVMDGSTTGGFPLQKENATTLTVADANNSGTRTQIFPSEVSAYNLVSGTAADGGYAHRKSFSAKTGNTYPTSTNISISQAASLSGDISIIEVIVSAIRIVTGTPNSIQAKSWKLRSYATKIDTSVTLVGIGTTEVLAAINTESAGLEVSLSIVSGSVVLSVDDLNAGDWTWGGEYTVTTAHVLVPGGGGGGK
jgi:hypothetical protein